MPNVGTNHVQRRVVPPLDKQIKSLQKALQREEKPRTWSTHCWPKSLHAYMSVGGVRKGNQEETGLLRQDFETWSRNVHMAIKLLDHLDGASLSKKSQHPTLRFFPRQDELWPSVKPFESGKPIRCEWRKPEMLKSLVGNQTKCLKGQLLQFHSTFPAAPALGATSLRFKASSLLQLSSLESRIPGTNKHATKK